ncbi:hypothetical protein AU197_22210 [Mycobacterium sp. IS-1590]|uniref:hypothetical protein n=1 Tax=Mycobacterium sp. IS-1590 TaxID=1772286 RepID=UPI000747D750|nr:hypothetical protein [Mycobacterium sp. IS-1590]KUI43468.1 hypothetical protein AU197_22210 [Mycobacterium sp. IS-1590]
MTRLRVRRLATRALVALAIGAGIVAGIMVITGLPIVSNAWSAATEPAYVIPAESSMWRFTPTQMNEGSGDWWVYGQDDRNYYYFTGSGEPPYLVMPKVEATACAGFESTDHRTWCR